MLDRWPVSPIVLGRPRPDHRRHPPLGSILNSPPSRFGAVKKKGATTCRIRRAWSCTHMAEEDEIQSSSGLLEKKGVVTCQSRRRMRSGLGPTHQSRRVQSHIKVGGG
jgi:hypothetical protein